MNTMFDALTKAFRDLFQFRILWIVIWPIVSAVLMWFVLGVIFWETFSDWDYKRPYCAWYPNMA